jgi:hypothetical protein
MSAIEKPASRVNAHIDWRATSRIWIIDIAGWTNGLKNLKSVDFQLPRRTSFVIANDPQFTAQGEGHIMSIRNPERNPGYERYKKGRIGEFRCTMLLVEGLGSPKWKSQLR